MPVLDVGSTLGGRAARGGAALLLGEGATRVASILGLVVLAAVLSPEQFGVVAVATFASNALGTLFGLGIGPALQSLDPSDRRDRSCLFLALMVGVTATGAILLTAPILANLLGEPSATSHIRACAPTVLLARWAEVRLAIIERSLAFSAAAVVNVVSVVLGVAVALATALNGAGAWALVLQVVVMHVSLAVGTTLVGDGARRPEFHPSELAALWHRLRPVLANSVLAFAYTNADDAAVARISGATALGLYSFAYRISNLPTHVFTHTINRVMLPTYRALSSEGRPWAEPFRRVTRLLALASGTVLIGGLLHGPDLLTSLYGDKWTASYPALRILAVYGLLRTIGASMGPVLLAAGIPEIARRIAQWQTVVMLGLLIPSVSLGGIAGAALAVTLPLGVATLVMVILASRLAGASPTASLGDVLQSWVAALAANITAIPIVDALGGVQGLAIGTSVVVAMIAGYCRLFLREEMTSFGQFRRA